MSADDELAEGQLFPVLRVAPVSVARSEDFAEANAAQWGTFASDAATASVTNSTARLKDRTASILFTTASGFDTGVKSPANPSLDFDASAFNSLVLWECPVNTTPVGWQDLQPIVVIRTTGGTITLPPDSPLTGYSVWQQYNVPFDGGVRWTRTTSGTPNLRHVTQIEIHHDTWDAGFRIWLDGIRFAVSAPY